ncbi:MAG: hypothetical protein JSV88_03080 [Candidatus Aminicenantes bacterium]|nr:MAG: hypothetical protein JSV88_03080 [Candidatus Aminicenantes bacterium]
MTLKDPVGKVHKQQKGSSPIKLEFWVTQQLLKKGGEWKITFYNESKLKTKGTITITYPSPTFAQPQKGWCCFDGRVFPATREECRKRNGQFFLTREAAERHCRQERPGPEEPEEGWCCKDGEVFPADEAECAERGGQFYVCEEDARRYCPGPEPDHEIAPPPPPPHPDMRPYPAVPTANIDVEGLVPLDNLEKVANAHAHETWGEEIAPGPPFPVADREGKVFAYVFHYIRGSQQFPGYEQIFDGVRSWQNESEVALMGEQFGYIYVSATDKNFPILMVSHYLHPYFLVGDLAQEQANRHFDSDEVRLDKIYFLNPHDEYFEFVSHGKSIVFNVNSLEKKTPAAALDVEPFAHKTGEHMRKISEAWERATQLQPVGTPAEDAAKTHTEKRILHWKRPPPIPHTWWCVPTTEANILGFWDNYARGSGTFLGYGRFIKYWFEHHTYCHLPSGAHANCKWSGAIHNNVPDIIDVIIDPKTGTWRKGFTGLTDRIARVDNYKFSSGTVTPTASNEWAWKDVKKEVDSGRPAFWSFKAHMVAAIGYRITNSGQKLVITYDSYGVTFSQKIKEYTYDWCNGFRWVIPGGGTNGDHMIIDSPDGGENLTRMVPYDITWWVWGVKITKTTISFSSDGGRNWTTIASDGNLWHKYQNQPNSGSWGPWKIMGNPPGGIKVLSQINAAANKDGRLEVFIFGIRGKGPTSVIAPWHIWQVSPNNGWSKWAGLGAPPGKDFESLAVGQNKDGRLEVFAIASDDNSLWHISQK